MIHKIENEQDLIDILKEAAQLHAQTHWKKFELDMRRIVQYLEAAHSKKDKFFFVYERDEEGKIAGLFLGLLVAHPLVKVVKASDLTYYVAPTKRGSRLFNEMLAEFEKWAKENGAHMIELYHNTGINTEYAPKIMNPKGYQTAGYIFHKEL